MFNWAFAQDAAWRAIRTASQCLAGLLVTSHVSNAFNAPWHDLLGASLLAGATSLLMSIDRSTVLNPVLPAAPLPAAPAPLVSPPPVSGACGNDLR
jgi:hypothetical protein